MNKEFIPYEQALELKELGFNESCIGYYRQGEVSIVFAGNYLSELELEKNFEGDGDPMFGDKGCTAPLYQQAFRWFREKYRLYPEIIYSARDKHWVCQWSDSIGFELLGSYTTYEDAELACLKKLIEIAKNK